jgi:hypothetical protein
MNPKEKFQTVFAPKKRREMLDFIKARYPKSRGNSCIHLGGNCPTQISDSCPIFQAGQKVSEFIDIYLPPSLPLSRYNLEMYIKKTGASTETLLDLNRHLGVIEKGLEKPCPLQKIMPPQFTFAKHIRH